MTIPKQYKDTLNNLINSLYPESPDWAESIDKKFRNVSISESRLANLLERGCLDKNFLDKSLQLASKIEDSQICQCYIIVSWVKYKKSKREEEDCQGNKISLVVGKNSNIEVNIYHYVID